ncbi:MAG TPA: hypothetical protein VE993_11805 [Stellaceae bacterium]|nr:hypothetical protein [Stellaceae bacterium]
MALIRDKKPQSVAELVKIGGRAQPNPAITMKAVGQCGSEFATPSTGARWKRTHAASWGDAIKGVLGSFGDRSDGTPYPQMSDTPVWLSLACAAIAS